MHQRPVPFAQAMIPIGIDHVVEGFPKGDQPVDQPFDDLNMGIGLARTRHNQQLSLETLGETQDQCLAMVLWGSGNHLFA